MGKNKKSIIEDAAVEVDKIPLTGQIFDKLLENGDSNNNTKKLFSISKIGFNDNGDETNTIDVLKKYKDIIGEFSVADTLEVMGMEVTQLYKPIDRDVEKLVVDVSIIVLQYLQNKLLTDTEVKIENLHATIIKAMKRVTTGLLEDIYKDRK